jgi:hypothetical protein
MNRAMQHRVFALVGEEFVLDLCKPRGFEPIDQPAERHGSWQWTLRKHARELDCFVSMAFTSLPRAVPDSDWYAVEIWAGAEKADRYTRKPVSDFRARGPGRLHGAATVRAERTAAAGDVDGGVSYSSRSRRGVSLKIARIRSVGFGRGETPGRRAPRLPLSRQLSGPARRHSAEACASVAPGRSGGAPHEGSLSWCGLPAWPSVPLLGPGPREERASGHAWWPFRDP